MWDTLVRENLYDEDNHDQNEIKMVPFVLEEILITNSDYPQHYVDQENHLEYVVNDVELVPPRAYEGNAIYEG